MGVEGVIFFENKESSIKLALSDGENDERR